MASFNIKKRTLKDGSLRFTVDVIVKKRCADYTPRVQNIQKKRASSHLWPKTTKRTRDGRS